MAEITEQIVREAPEIEKIKLGLLQSAKTLSETRPSLPAYQVAGLTPEQLDAMKRGVSGIGAYAPFMQGAQTATTAGAGLLGQGAEVLTGADTRAQFEAARQALQQAAPSFGQAQGVLGQGVGALAGAAQGFTPSNVQAFMNPYQQQVIEESLRQINRQGDIARQNLQAQAVRAGAFGGSREGVQRAELERGLSEQRNAAITGALAQGYQSAAQQAQQAFEQQQQRQLAQAQGYQGAAGLYGNLEAQRAGLGQQAAGMYGTLAQQQFGVGSQLAAGLGSLGTQLGAVGLQQGQLGEAAQRLGQQDVSFLYGLGQQQQAQQQRELDALRATQLQSAYQPMQQLAFLSDIYKGAPSTQMALTTQAAPTPSPFQQIAGLGTGLLATGAAIKQASGLY